MTDTNKLKKRDFYLNKLIALRDTEAVKVITGIRRCGKSSLLRLMVEYLKKNGVSEKQIIEIHFELPQYSGLTSGWLYSFVRGRVVPGQKMYLFLDEAQLLPCWEDAVNLFKADIDCDIYVTGSNVYLLSSEYSARLSVEYTEIKMYPLSFREFLDYNGFSLKEVKGAEGKPVKRAYDRGGKRYELRELFDDYMSFGGMPELAEAGIDRERAFVMLDNIYSSIVVRDILERENRKLQKRITDATLLRKIILYLSSNIGENFSISSVSDALFETGLLDSYTRGNPGIHTVQVYTEALFNSYLFTEVKRYDMRKKIDLLTLGKYYIVDIGLRNYLLPPQKQDKTSALENLVYLELCRRGYKLSIGKIYGVQVDFAAERKGEKAYFQVAESMTDKKICRRKLAPLRRVSDEYERTVLSLSPGEEDELYGIKSRDLTDWLLEER